MDYQPFSNWWVPRKLLEVSEIVKKKYYRQKIPKITCLWVISDN